MSNNYRPPKSSRKSRRRRINIGFSSEWQTFEPTDHDWIVMEKAIGQKLTAEVRFETTKIVQRYFKVQPFEKSAPFLDDVLKRMEIITKAIANLQKALGEGGLDNLSDIVRAQLAQGLDGNTWEHIEELDEGLRLLFASAQQAKLDFIEQSSEGLEEGDAWQEMAASLKELMRSRGLPHGASQDEVKHSTNPPFVEFFMKLQDVFPKASLRRQSASPLAFGKQIGLAVRAHRIRSGS